MRWVSGRTNMDTHANLIGEKFPYFSLKDSEKNTFSNENLLDRWSVIFFYPKDGSPGCTIESCSFRDKQDQIEALGAQIIGISSDSVSRHQRFKKKHSFKAISTRKYYQGLHKIEVIINGVTKSEYQFELLEGD